VAASAANLEAAKDDYAIVVGIGQYPLFKKGGQDRDLDGPANDVAAMTSWLVGTAGVPCDHIVVMNSSGSGTDCKTLGQWGGSNHPSRNDLYSLLEQHVEESTLRSLTGNPRIGRRLWVYMAGHGFSLRSATREVCIITADSLPDTLVRNACVTRFIDWIAQEPAFDEVVLFLDCCSEVAAGLTPGLPQEQNVVKRQQPARRLMITAAQFTKQTFEEPDANGQVGGIFTRHLLDALGGAAGVSGTGHVTSSELKAYFENLANPDAKANTGKLQAKVHEADPIELIHLGAPASPQQVIATGRPPGSKLDLIDGFDRLIAADLTVAADGTVSRDLPVGLYRLSQGGQDKLFQVAAEGVTYG
jgi:hypothetical protein